MNGGPLPSCSLILLPLSVLRTCVKFVDKVLFITYCKILHLFGDD